MIKGSKRKPKPEPVPFGLSWRWHHEGAKERRIWRNDWYGDQFEIMTDKAFGITQGVCQIFSIPLTQAEED